MYGLLTPPYLIGDALDKAFDYLGTEYTYTYAICAYDGQRETLKVSSLTPDTLSTWLRIQTSNQLNTSSSSAPDIQFHLVAFSRTGCTIIVSVHPPFIRSCPF